MYLNKFSSQEVMFSKVITRDSRRRPWSKKELLIRYFWGWVGVLMFLSPRVAFSYRACLLRCFGAKLGKGVHIYRTARIAIPFNLEVGDRSTIGDHAEIYNLGKVVIGSRTTISQRAHLCAGTHDYNDPSLPMLKLGIMIGDDAWICTDAFVGPGVNIGNGSIVGARAVAVKSVPPWKIVAGNPAKLINDRVMTK